MIILSKTKLFVMYGQEIAWTEGRKKAFKSVAKDLPKYLDPTK